MKQKTRYNFTAGNLETFVNKSSENITWITGDRLVLKVSEMSINHIENVIEWIVENRKSATQMYLNRSFGEWLRIFRNELDLRAVARKEEAKKEYYELLSSAGSIRNKVSEIESLVKEAKVEADKLRIENNKKIMAAQRLQREWGF